MSTVTRDLLSRREAAAYIGVAEQTLAIWASTGRYHLPYIRVGRKAMYRREDLDAWLESRTATSTGERDARQREQEA
jgi:excisionase family DNA binding protein